MTNTHDQEKKSGKERRHVRRFKAPIPIEYKTLTLNPIFGKTLAKDLSKNGLRIDSKEPLSAGTNLEISFNVPGDNLPVFASGKVAWADGLDAGIKITKINHSDRSKVLEYVYQEWLSGVRKSNGHLQR